MKNGAIGDMPRVDASDWAKVRALSDADIHHDADSPRTKPSDWDGAVMKQGGVVVGRVRGVNKRPTKEQVAVRYSPEVLAAFRASGAGWQTRMNAALADWLKSHSPNELTA
ncbi:MAG: BrnA antitoxin family protein [Gallionella sp.]